MGLDEPLGILREMEVEDGRCTVSAMPILPENMAIL
jgi:hypothetical protein